MKRRTFIGAVGATGLAIGAGGIYWKRKKTKSSHPVIVSPSLEEFDPKQEYDVCIIGSGPAGCTVAGELLKAGKRVLMLESGSDIYHDESAGNIASRLDVYQSVGPIEYPVAASRVRGVGGTSNIWTGRCPRLRPSDFKGNPIADFSWPLSYKELQDYYYLAEKKLYVSGEKLTAGHAPRKKPLPFSRHVDLSQLRQFIDPLNVDIDAPPQSQNPETGSTLRFVDLVPHLQSHNSFQLVTNATATALIPGAESNIAAIEVQGFKKESGSIVKKTIRAKKIVVAAGALESARLLLLSKSSQFPNGIGNHSDKLGRYFMEHPFEDYYANMPEGKKFSKWMMGRTYQYSSRFNDKGFGDVLVGFYANSNKLKLAFGIEMKASPDNRVLLNNSRKDAFGNPVLDIYLAYSNSDREMFSECGKLAKEIYSKLDCTNVEKMEYTHWSHHHMGCTRMSHDAVNGVVDKNLKVFGTNNLYIASSGVFVSSGAANPTLTITALSLRLGKYLGRDT